MGETLSSKSLIKFYYDLFDISRYDQDVFALKSQQKASEAQKNGRLAQEIISVAIPQRKKDPILFKNDEFIKPTTTFDVLSKLRPAFKPEKGSVTAGNASGLNDGAAALLIASQKAVDKYRLKPMAKIMSSAVVGVEPKIMGIGPVRASLKALEKAGLTLDQINVIELNEAFAAQSLACMRELGLQDDDPRVNPNGGAIAMGHPLGMTGARILFSAAKELQLKKKKYALVTMCVGVGQGYACVIEAV